MAYIHKKTIGNQTYYSLRVSERKGSRVITRDICNLGTDLSKIRLENLEERYRGKIRKSHRILKRFIESNNYEQQARKQKLKKQALLTEEALYEIEAARIHYTTKFQKLDHLTQKEIFESFLIRFAVNSTAIEGNTIGLKEAAKLLQEEIIPKDHTMREVYDLTNTQKTFYELVQKRQKLDMDLIIWLHDKLLENIDARKGFRNHDIHIVGQPFEPSPARYVNADMDLLLRWYNQSKDTLHPFILAVLFHHKFECIHPFSDGNGRTGRLVMNHILMIHNYPPIIINIKDREDYLDAMSWADVAIKKGLASTSNEYLKLTSFMSSELQQSYWDVFLF